MHKYGLAGANFFPWLPFRSPLTFSSLCVNARNSGLASWSGSHVKLHFSCVWLHPYL